jgi:hypothetical protein
MIRNLALAAAMALVLGAAGSRAEAGPVSASNPYRSFNLTGVNYGSMRWERAHRGSSVRGGSLHGTAWGRRGGLFFRRR